MGPGSAWNYGAMVDAIADAGLREDQYRKNPRAGLIMGSGGASTSAIVRAADINREKGSPRRIGPFEVPKTMGSTASATLAVPFGIFGVNFTNSAACSTSALCIRNACLEIMLGYQDLVFAGGSEELDWTLSNAFDAMGAMSSKRNDEPQKASRAYDADRDGFVIAGGGGVLVLEELSHARARQARIYAEIVGLGHTSDGYDMVAPSGEGAERCMRLALDMIPEWNGQVDYVNPHATSTPLGDVIELVAIDNVLDLRAQKSGIIAGTKSLSGHSLGTADAQEAIYTLLAMWGNFIPANANVEKLDPEIVENDALVRSLALQVIEDVEINIALSNSFGFGGTNATLVFRKWH
jgi:3-oxoacyl-[acyl-carrier-protein] synthase-1